ncbi:MAG: DUF4232 domain-containing protein [Actinobacteria bacterium]|nr:MAG: DUF4232 domain-containing protein [Actinomycetota bacterium]
MPDLEDRLRDVLERRASSVAPHDVPPPGMLRRARRRAALVFGGAALVIAVAATGSVVGVRAVEGSGHRAASPSLVRSCRAGDLTAKTELQGATGSVFGSIVVTNRTNHACTLTGWPNVQIADSDNKVFAIKELSTAPWWQQNGQPRPRGWPVVTLAPRAAAVVRVSWANWCHPSQAPAGWRVELRGGTVVARADPGNLPICSGPGYPSILQVGPFEPRK